MAKTFSLIFLFSVVLITISLFLLGEIGGILISALGLGLLVGAWDLWWLSKKMK